MNNTVGQLDWGTYVNGTWEGVLGYLANGTADTSCLFFQRTELRAKYFSYSYPITNVSVLVSVRQNTRYVGRAQLRRAQSSNGYFHEYVERVQPIRFHHVALNVLHADRPNTLLHLRHEGRDCDAAAQRVPTTACTLQLRFLLLLTLTLRLSGNSYVSSCTSRTISITTPWRVSGN